MLIARARTWNPFSYCTRPQVSTIGGRISGHSPADHHVGSMPLGTRWMRSAGSSKPVSTSRDMNIDGAITWSDPWASHDSTAWIVLGSPGGMRPPCWLRNVVWNVVTSGAPCSAAIVVAAQAHSQLWAWTTSGRQSPSSVVRRTR